MRRCKVGIDYFSHDVDMLQDKKVKLLKAKRGLLGYAVYLRLLEETYKDTGYYLKCDNDFNALFSDDNNIDYNVYILILNDCINVDLFNGELYNAYHILTSKRIQENYCTATERRKEVEFIKQYLLIDVVSRYKKEVNVNILTLDSHISTQSKVKENRIEQNRIEQNIVVPYQAIFDLFNETCKSIPKIKVLSKSRKEKLKTRWEEMPDIEQWKKLFETVEQSPFLKGDNKNSWKCTFDWLIENDKNYLKVLEGNFNNKKEVQADDPYDVSKMSEADQRFYGYIPSD